jgi:glutathione peroxidase-family protein
VDAQETKKIVIASGGVKATSIQPLGITVTADKVTWYFAKDLIIAEGRVYIQYQPVGAPQPVDWGGPVDRLTINTELKKFHIP